MRIYGEKENKRLIANLYIKKFPDIEPYEYVWTHKYDYSKMQRAFVTCMKKVYKI